MKRLMSAAAFMLVLGSGAALVQVMGSDGPGARGAEHHGPARHGRGHDGHGLRGMMMLQAADLNGDNSVTRAEIDQLQTDEFAFRDRNADGFLDQADASPMRQRMMTLREARQEAREDRPGRGQGRGGDRDGRMQDADLDGDGRISRSEFMTRPQAMFDRLDSNADGAITPDELDAHMQELADRREARRAPWWRD